MPWAKYLNQIGYTVSTPLLPGHGSNWQDLNETTWQQWYEQVEKSFLELKKSCDRIFIAGFSMGGALALRFCQIRGSEIEGLIVLNPSVQDLRWYMKLTPLLKYLIPSLKKGATDVAAANPPKHAYGRTPLKAWDSLRKLHKVVVADLYLIDLPIMVAYSINDHAVDPANSLTVINNVASLNVREVIFENSFHNVALDLDLDQLNNASKLFIEDVLTGRLKSGSQFDATDLVDTEFDSIISGLSLDQSSPTTYLDELDRTEDNQHFIAPKPGRVVLDQVQRFAVAAFLASFSYLLIYTLTDFEIFGVWPAVLGFLAFVAIIIWRTARSEDNFDDGASL